MWPQRRRSADACAAQRGFDESKVPLLGVMGAFVFAAQMINFPVGIGTSGHLVGGALLAVTLGPAPASVVMCAILAIQALVFQDGGILALGANVFNMAVAGVLAGYLPYSPLGRRPVAAAVDLCRRSALACSSARVLALARIADLRRAHAGAVLGISLALFVVSALLEGAITLAVVQALERIQPGFVRAPTRGRFAGIGGARRWSPCCWRPAACCSPPPRPMASKGWPADRGSRRTPKALISDSVERLPGRLARLRHWLSKAGAGLAGLGLIYGACVLIDRAQARRST